MILGRISSVFGVKGWVKIVSHTQPKENIFSYPVCLVKRDSKWHEVKLLNGKPQGKTLVAQLQGVTTREQAEEWIGTTIAVTRDMLPEPDKGDYYWVDLIGLEVMSVQGQKMGTVVKLMETGSNDVLVVKDSTQNAEVLIPWLDQQVIKDVDLTSGVITVDWDNDY
ncbi:MAG: ribosome maturation factor RimM [Gammaproteobacteria bacterium]|nr:ribosome maturation factor RimM [Gammaproteobacteria bacterium]